MKEKSAPYLQIDHTRVLAYLPVPKHVTQGPLSRDRMTVGQESVPQHPTSVPLAAGAVPRVLEGGLCRRAASLPLWLGLQRTNTVAEGDTPQPQDFMADVSVFWAHLPGSP
jgi:hypothetical protein